MKALGSVLKEARKSRNFSLKYVEKETGITDSRLSRIENDAICPSIKDIHSLSTCYNHPLLYLLRESGYITDEMHTDTAEQSIAFQDSHLLSEEEREHIQNEIKLFTKGRK